MKYYADEFEVQTNKFGFKMSLFKMQRSST